METVKKERFKITLIIIPKQDEQLPDTEDKLNLGEAIKDFIYDNVPVEDVTYEIDELEDN